jgi:hypothetical protein
MCSVLKKEKEKRKKKSDDHSKRRPDYPLPSTPPIHSTRVGE